MTKITIHAAKTNLSKLIAQVEAGEEVVICRGDLEVARLVSAQAPWGSSGAWDGKSPRKPGQLRGVITLDESFFETES